MKATGIVRKVDELGRIVLPVELRRTFGIDIKELIEIYVDESSIVLKKHQGSCYICGETKGLKLFKGKNICSGCIRDCLGL